MHKAKRAIIMADRNWKANAAGQLAYTEAVNKSKWSAHDRHCHFGASQKLGSQRSTLLSAILKEAFAELPKQYPVLC